MTFVVSRQDGRFELRQSRHRPGRTPQAVTLATFRTLDDGVLARAEARAGAPLDRARCRRLAADAGAPIVSPGVAQAAAAHRALAAARRGALPDELGRALSAVLAGDRPDGPASWIGAAAEERAAALADLLGTVDRLPPPRGSRPFDRRLVAAGP